MLTGGSRFRSGAFAYDRPDSFKRRLLNHPKLVADNSTQGNCHSHSHTTEYADVVPIPV